MNVHIALIGGQVYPAYLGIADLQPDVAILIHSTNTKNEAERIQREFPNVNAQLVEFNPVDIEEIFSQTRHLLDEVTVESMYTINVTGGTKLWTLAFYECFKNLNNVKLIYIDQNNRIYDLVSMDKRLATVHLDMDLLFRLNGTAVKSYMDYKEYTSEDAKCLVKIMSLRRYSYTIFNEMSGLDDERILSDNESTLHFPTMGTRTHDEGKLSWDKTYQCITIEMITKKGIRIETLKSPHVFNLFFHAGWFEYEVARILSGWKYAKEIRMNVCFPYHTDDKAKNEIDIIVNTGNRLLFVECKTQIHGITDIDKFRTAVKNYGGMSSKALFITKAKMRSNAIEKCQDSDILCFGMEDKDNSWEISKELFATLERELFEINKK